QSWREQLAHSLLAAAAEATGCAAPQPAWLAQLPRSYSRYGDLALFPEGTLDHPSFAELAASGRLWPTVCGLLKVRRLAVVRRVARDGVRSSRSRLLYTEPGCDPASATVATCVEHGVSLSWDIADCMFSRGNAAERHRLVPLVAAAAADGSESCIVDLFAGIGYFTLPLLARTGIAQVIAIDWNPAALRWLRRNLQNNRIGESRCRVLQGDNRLVAPAGLADRVLLGLVPSSRLSWPAACRCLRPAGGWLHVHENCDSPREATGCNKDHPNADGSDKDSEDASRTDKDLSVRGSSDGAFGGLAITSNCFYKDRAATAAAHAAFLNSPHAPAAELPPPDAADCDEDPLAEAAETPPVCSRSRPHPAWLSMAASMARELRRHMPPGWRVRVARIQFVKWYAPRVAHLVFDVECRPAG
uniref:tRNA wybutosine-synthesizing protein 2 homolog n=2 Tax=Macrostomum lignano TaxID=282301 RepID=A0A1I8JGH1_9PLAT